ncbi:MAG: hypothetical protein ACXVCE_15250, partial [Bacteriovorax sp.]
GTSERMRIDAAGNVGIGTTSPTEHLHLLDGFLSIDQVGTTNTSGIKLNGVAANTVPFIRTYNPDNATNKYVWWAARDGSLFSVEGASVDGGSGTVYFNVTEAGNVGIGTSAPAEKLEVSGNVKISGGGTIVQESWITPSLANGWLDYATSGDANWGPVAYYKGTDGRVYLRGLVRAGTCGSTIFTLPAGYRPSKFRLFTSSSADAYVRVNVNSAGQVYAGTGCNNTWVSLDGISFRVVGD